MLKLRRAVVREVVEDVDTAHAGLAHARAADRADAACAEQQLVVELADVPGSRRRAVVDVGLLGRAQVGDELIVNVQALELGLGSGGFDVVHVNLTRGLQDRCDDGQNVMKLNYTSLQHAVTPVEDEQLRVPLDRPVAVISLHGQLSAVAWAFAQAAPGRTLGYVQTEGGALPAGHSRTVAELRRRGLLVRHLSAGAAFGAEGEAITAAGALHHGLGSEGWDAAVCGPGPGIVGSSSALGHGGMFALDSAHAALALGCPTVLVARMSGADTRERHRGLSHHTRTVLALLLAGVLVALPAGHHDAAAEITQAAGERHEQLSLRTDLAGFASSGLPAQAMGRGPREDPLFFEAALAGGSALALACEQPREDG